MRPAQHTYAQLETDQQAVLRILDTLHLPAGVAINVMENRVGLGVTDRAAFDAALAEGNTTLPESVVISIYYESVGVNPPFDITPVPEVFMPQLKQRDVAFMEALLIGDTNSGLPDIDEESPAFTKPEADFMNGLDKANWKDMFRAFHGNTRAYTWYSPNGRNGFRLDQAFVNAELQQRVASFRYVWGDAGEHNQLSDHAAILLDLKE